MSVSDAVTVALELNRALNRIADALEASHKLAQEDLAVRIDAYAKEAAVSASVLAGQSAQTSEVTKLMNEQRQHIKNCDDWHRQHLALQMSKSGDDDVLA